MDCPTVKIQCQPGPGNELGEVTINERDYNPAIHTLVGKRAEPTQDPAGVPASGKKRSGKLAPETASH